MSAPRAVGVRAPWIAVPARVRTWVDETLGSPVIEHVDVVGGMSPGCATRLTCADGTRAFVKAVGVELNPETPAMFRREARVLALIGSDPLWARLEAAYDDGGWVALLLEDVEGRHPDLADDDEMALLLGATDRLAAVLADRVPEPPATPAADEGGLHDFADVVERWAGALDRAAERPLDLLPDWVCADAGDWAARVRSLADTGPGRLVHWDIRNDNLLLRPSGELVFLDWGAALVGPDWLDPLLARLERMELSWFDASLATSPPLARVGDDAVTAWLVGFSAFLAWRAETAQDVNLPTLGEFRRREARRALGAAARRLSRDLGGPEPRW